MAVREQDAVAGSTALQCGRNHLKFVCAMSFRKTPLCEPRLMVVGVDR